VSGRSGIDVAPAATTDPSAPAENASVVTRMDSGGKPQVRVTVSPSPSVDPADPKPAEAPKPEAKVEDKPAAEAAPVTRPSWLPEKFATPMDLKKATIELAQKQGAPGYVIRGLEASESGQEVSDAYKAFEKQIDPNAGKPAEPKQEEKPAEEQPPAAEVPAPTVQKTEEDKAYERETYGTYVAGMLDTVGVRAVDLGEEFAKNGNKLTEATYEKFAKAGVARPFMDAYIAGMVGNATVMAEKSIAEVKASVGGDAEFGKLAVWGSANMTKDQHELYTTMTNSGSVIAAKEAVKMLKGWYDAANGTPPKLVKATTTEKPAENLGYASRQEMIADMNNPRYKANDRAFHKMVEEKLKHTKTLA